MLFDRSAKKKLFASLVSLLFSISFASAIDEEDPYRPLAKIPKGPFKGMKINTGKRPIKVLKGSEAAVYQGDTSDSLVIANLNSGADKDGKPAFVIARIPENALEEAILQTTTGAFLGHTQLRFKFNQDIPLFPQPGNPEPVLKTTRDIIYSVDATLPEGHDYFNTNGILDNAYPRVHRFLTLEEDFFYKVISRKRPIRQFPIALSKNQQNDLWKAALQRSEEAQYKDMLGLGLCVGNCTTETFALIDKVTPFNSKYFLVRNIPTLPFKQDYFMWLRDLAKLEPNTQAVVEYQTENEEFEHLKSEPQFRERFKADIKRLKNAKKLAQEEGRTLLPSTHYDVPLKFRIRSTLCSPIYKRIMEIMTAKKSESNGG